MVSNNFKAGLLLVLPLIFILSVVIYLQFGYMWNPDFANKYWLVSHHLFMIWLLFSYSFQRYKLIKTINLYVLTPFFIIKIIYSYLAYKYEYKDPEMYIIISYVFKHICYLAISIGTIISFRFKNNVMLYN